VRLVGHSSLGRRRAVVAIPASPPSPNLPGSDVTRVDFHRGGFLRSEEGRTVPVACNSSRPGARWRLDATRYISREP